LWTIASFSRLLTPQHIALEANGRRRAASLADARPDDIPYPRVNRPIPARRAAGSCVLAAGTLRATADGHRPLPAIPALRQRHSHFSKHATKVADGQQRYRLIEVRLDKILSQLERCCAPGRKHHRLIRFL